MLSSTKIAELDATIVQFKKDLHGLELEFNKTLVEYKKELEIEKLREIKSKLSMPQ